MSSHRRLLIIPLTLVLATGLARGEWATDYRPPGPPGLTPLAIAELDGNLVVGGRAEGSFSAVQIFDAGEWQGLGYLEGQVAALAVHGGHLVAGGRALKTATTAAEVSLVVWDGLAWQAWPQGIDGSVTALLAANDVLYAAGRFGVAGADTLGNIAAWDGDSWDGLAGGFDREVHALCWHDGRLYAGGAFTSAAGAPVYGIAMWTGHTWSPLRGGIPGKVVSLVSHSGRLYAGGRFEDVDGKPLGGLAAWDGTTWSEVGGGLMPINPGLPIAIEALATTGYGLAVVGDFQAAADTSARRIAAWDGRRWRSLGTLRRNGREIRALGWQSSALIISADYPLDTEPVRSRVARYDGVTWSPLGGGTFTNPGSDLDLDNYRVDAAVTEPPVPPADVLAPTCGPHPRRIRSLTRWRGQVLGAGPFDRPLGTAGQSLCAWDGNSWRTLADLPYPGVPNVECLLPASRRLILLGDFRSIADSSALDACTWDGAEFRELSTRRPHWRHGARTIWQGSAVVAMDSTSPRGTRQFQALLACDGDAWRELPYPPAPIQALCEWQGNLVAAVNGPESGRTTLVAYDGGRWQALPGTFVGSVTSLASYDGALVAAGNFEAADSLVCHNVAFTAGSSWQPLAGGVDGYVSSLASSPGTLWFTGQFRRAGAQISNGFARWDGPLPRGGVDDVARYVPPPPQPERTGPIVDGWHSHGIDSREPAAAFRNGDFRDWDGGQPSAWEASAWYFTGERDSSVLPERLAHGGVRLRIEADARGRIELRQRFLATPGQGYRLRVLGRVLAPAPSTRVQPVHVRLSDYVRDPNGHEYGALHGGITSTHEDTTWTWWESSLVFDTEAGVGVAAIECWQGPVVLEVRRVEIDAVAIDAADILDDLFTQLERRFVPPCGQDVDWDALRARHLAAARRAEVPHCRELISAVLKDLPVAELAIVESSADVTQIGIVANVTRDCESGADKPGSIGTSRDQRAVARIFSPQLGYRSRDGILLCSKLTDLNDLAGVQGIVLDLRAGGWQNEWDSNWRGRQQDSPPWQSLARWADRRRYFGLRHERRLNGTATDSLCVEPLADRPAPIPLVAIIDRSTRGVAAVVAGACLSLDGVTVLGEATGPPYWPAAVVPLASGQSVMFPDSWFTWTTDGVPADAVAIPPEIVVEDAATRPDGEDPRLEEAVRLVRRSLGETPR